MGTKIGYQGLKNKVKQDNLRCSIANCDEVLWPGPLIDLGSTCFLGGIWQF
jgi:hypothetical protein